VFTICYYVLSWRATLQPVVFQSTTEAEYMTTAKLCKECVWLKHLYVEFSGDDFCIKLFCGSQSAIYLTKDQIFPC
jgi:hypothetical protein